MSAASGGRIAAAVALSSRSPSRVCPQILVWGSTPSHTEGTRTVAVVGIELTCHVCVAERHPKLTYKVAPLIGEVEVGACFDVTDLLNGHFEEIVAHFWSESQPHHCDELHSGASHVFPHVSDVDAQLFCAYDTSREKQ